MKYAPVLITTVNRYHHFRKCIESLSKCKLSDKTDVYVAVDYPARKEHWDGYNNIKMFLNKCGDLGFRSLNISYRKENYHYSGKSNLGSLIKEIQEEHDRYIISEDDNEFSINYLSYMNQCLEHFETDSDVVMVLGYSYPVKWDVSNGATCMKQNFNASMWGAGFWRDKKPTYVKYIRSRKLLDNVSSVIDNKLYQQMTDASLIEYIPAALNPCKKKLRFMTYVSDISMRSYLVVDRKYAISPVISKVRNNGFDGTGLYCQQISNDIQGNTAGTFCYSQQIIDTNPTFELRLNTKDSIRENRNRLNSFDARTPAQMRRTRLYLWLMNHFGIWAGKACATILFPYDISVKVLKKVWRKLQK